MLAAAVVDIGMMLVSAVLSAGIQSALMMIVITGAIPALAIATMIATEGGVKRRSVWPGVKPGGELTTLAARLRSRREQRAVGVSRRLAQADATLLDDANFAGYSTRTAARIHGWMQHWN